MADNDAPEQPAPEAAPQAPTPPAPDPPKQTEAPPEVVAALRKANKEAEKLRLQLKEYEDRDKSEAEKLAERAAAAERRAAEMEAQLMRREVALAKGLPAALVDRLRGGSREELDADADQLLALVAPPAPPVQEKRVPDLGQGRRDGAPAASVETGRERGRRDREAAEQKQRDPFAGMTVVRGV